MTLAIDRPELVSAYTSLSRGIEEVRASLNPRKTFSNLWGLRVKDNFELLRLIQNEDYPTWLAGRPYRMGHFEAESILKQVAEGAGLATVGRILEIPTGGVIELCPQDRGIHLLRIFLDDRHLDVVRTNWFVATEAKATQMVDSYTRLL